MNKSTYIVILLLSNFLFSSKSYEVIDDEKVNKIENSINITLSPLECIPYEKWPQNRKVISSPFISHRQSFENIVNAKDERKKIKNLLLKIRPNKEKVDVAEYVVKLHTYYGIIKNKEISGEGTATIIKISEGTIYLLTCAHILIKYLEKSSFFNNDSEYKSFFSAKSILFSYQGKKYPCKSYCVHPEYNEGNKRKDIAIIVSHRGYELEFPYNFFPETVSASSKKYKGYIIGYPESREKKEELYGMSGDLNVVDNSAVEYDNIDTSCGQSGSAIWAYIEGVYKIIGVHTTGSVFCNCGDSLSKKIIEWKKSFLFKTKEVYYRHAKIFNLGSDMKYILNEPNFDVDMKDFYGKTAFLIASQQGNLPALKLLKRKGANTNSKDIYGETALHLAIKNNVKIEVIKWLVKDAKINVNAKEYKQKTPFLYAAIKGNIPVLIFLKEQGAEVNYTEKYGKNALYLAIEKEVKFDVIEWLVNTAKVNINISYINKMTPFLLATQKRNLPVLKLLKEKGANINHYDSCYCNSLHWALLKKGVKIDLVKWLINVARVNINLINFYNKSPFLCAASISNISIIKLLKEKGANVNTTDKYGNNALHFAAGNPDMISWLLENTKIPIESKGKDKKTPFLFAAEKCSVSALKIFKEKGSNVNATDKDGRNGIWYARSNNSINKQEKAIFWLKNECGLQEN